MNFIRTLAASIYGPSFYRGIPGKPLKSSIGYFVLFIILIAVIQVLSMLPGILSVVSQQTIDSLVAKYPSDLQVTITNGKASINQPEPYFIPDTFDSSDAKTQNLIVIDTKDPFTTDEFAKYSTTAILTKDAIATKDSSGQVKLVPLDKVKNMTLTRDVVQGYAAKLYPYFIPAQVGIALFMVLIMTIANAFMLVYFFIPAFLIWLYCKLAKKEFTYGTSYKVALHAATFPMLVNVLIPLASIQLPPFTFTFLLLVVVVVNFTSKTKNPVPISLN